MRKMKNLYMVVAICVLSFTTAFAGGGIGYKGIKLNRNGSYDWYNVHDVTGWSYAGCSGYQFRADQGQGAFNGTNLGSFQTTDVLQIDGYGVVGWTDNTPTDWVSGQFKYKVWKQGESEPASWDGTIDVGNYNVGSALADVQCSSGNDRAVAKIGLGINIQPGVTGTYNLKVEPLGRMRYNGGSFNPNNGATVTATFTIVPPPAVEEIFLSSNTSIEFTTDADGTTPHKFYMLEDGRMGVGTKEFIQNATTKLAVEGTIAAREIIVTDASPFPDYVFEKGYKMMTLEELDAYIKEHGHLPNMTPAVKIHAEGMPMGEIQIKMVEKIEELTLYIIEQNKRIEALEAQLKK